MKRRTGKWDIQLKRILIRAKLEDLRGIMLAALLYTVHALLLPPHSVAVLAPTSTQSLIEPIPYMRPSTVALDANGVALVVHLTENVIRDNREWWTRGSPDRVVVEDDRMHVLPFPAVKTLAPFS